MIPQAERTLHPVPAERARASERERGWGAGERANSTEARAERQDGVGEREGGSGGCGLAARPARMIGALLKVVSSIREFEGMGVWKVVFWVSFK